MKPVSGKRLARALRRKGWTLDRTNGAHQTFVSPDGSTQVTVPAHNKDLKRIRPVKVILDVRVASAQLTRSALSRLTSSAYNDAFYSRPCGWPSFLAWSIPARTRSRHVSRTFRALRE